MSENAIHDNLWPHISKIGPCHYSGIIKSVMASRITSLSIVCQIICSGAYQRKYQGSASLAFLRGIHRWPMDSPHKRPVTREMCPFDDVIMNYFSMHYVSYAWYHNKIIWALWRLKPPASWLPVQHLVRACNEAKQRRNSDLMVLYEGNHAKWKRVSNEQISEVCRHYKNSLREPLLGNIWTWCCAKPYDKIRPKILILQFHKNIGHIFITWAFNC